MKPSDRESQMALARLACGDLLLYSGGQIKAILLADEQRERVSWLVEHFMRLDRSEQKRIKGGAKAGRPRSKKPSAEALRKRKARKSSKKGAT